MRAAVREDHELTSDAPGDVGLTEQLEAKRVFAHLYRARDRMPAAPQGRMGFAQAQFWSPGFTCGSQLVGAPKRAERSSAGVGVPAASFGTLLYERT